MGFESQGGDSFSARSPGGFEFGLTGFSYGAPVPKSITFFLDGSCVVADQYGRRILGAQTPGGLQLRFADSPPDASREGAVVPRPQFATHAQVIAALAEERIDWLAYEVRYRARDGSAKHRGGLTRADAAALQAKLLQEGNAPVTADRTIACAGWPQLSYAELKRLPELPPTPLEELRKIADPELRRDALRVRREADAARDKEMAAVEAE